MSNTSTAALESLLTECHKVIVGQPQLLNRLLVALLCRGHVLLEGLPGLAKTRTIKPLAAASHTSFRRIQFTPDLLPSDVVGTLIFDPKALTFTPKKGPVFTNLLLADEINRAPSKVQAALLEAMEERQVTLGEESFPLPNPFLVLATQNPLEQEGTFPLPEAQMDRFLFKLRVDYPKQDEEIEVLRRAHLTGDAVRPVVDAAILLAAGAAGSLRRDRHPEPGGVRGHLPPARGPARPVPAQAHDAAATARGRGAGAHPARRGLRPA
jgi:MoxR-like ATPase